MSPEEYRIVLRYPLIIPLFHIDEVCPICCMECLDTFEEHVVHCEELPSFKCIHDFFRDVLYDLFKRAGSISEEEEEEEDACELLDRPIR